MKKKFLKLFTSVAMLALVFCLHQNVRAEEIAQPTEKDVYIHHDDGEDYVANRYERAIVVDRVVYQYLPEKDSYRIVAFDDNDEEFPEGITFKPRSEVRGKPVTGIYIDGEEDGPSYLTRLNLVLPDSVKDIEISGASFGSITLPKFLIVTPGVIFESDFEQIIIPEGTTNVSGIHNIWKLRKMELPSSTKRIGKYFLEDSSDLRTVYIPEGVTEIGAEAFSGCPKLEIYIPASVKKIGKNAFKKTDEYGQVKMIYCANNSAAHKYAKKNHLPYTIIDPVKTSYKATDLSLSTKQISMPIGAKKRVLYQVTPVYAAKRNVKFSSSNSKVVSVNAKGMLTAKKNGKATITVQLKSGSKKKVKLKVVVQPRAPYLSADSVENKNTTVFTWNKSEGEEGYELSCSDTKNGTYKVIKKVTGKTKIIFKASTKKYYKIRAWYRTAKGKKYYSDYSEAVYHLGHIWFRD